MLIDQATIYVRGGKGGDGALSFRREKFIPKGGPDGGDGGDGGDVVLVGDSHSATLLSLARNPHLRAKHGHPGMGKSMYGADGEDFIARVPLGTLVYDAETGERLADISEHGQRVIAAKGGRGGLGNEHFKSATNQTPREFTLGELGEEKTLRLELKLIADVGLIGMPNAGKSTMLRAISRATPKVADYPFTTLSPYLGIAELPGDRRLIVADIPGLIEGAAQGAGLGHDFLRHIERTSVLVHVLDVAPIDGTEPAANYEAIRREIFEYSPQLAEKTEIIVLNKVDVLPEEERDERLRIITNRLALPAGEEPIITSGATGEGVRELLETCWTAAKAESQPPAWPQQSSRE
jgi:GTPase